MDTQKLIRVYLLFIRWKLTPIQKVENFWARHSKTKTKSNQIYFDALNLLSLIYYFNLTVSEKLKKCLFKFKK